MRWRSARTSSSGRSPRPMRCGSTAVAKYILDHGLAQAGVRRQVGEQVRGVSRSRSSLTRWSTRSRSRASASTTLKQVADEIAAADGVCILWAMGVTQHCGGSDTSTAISNLLLLTGNYMRPGAGAYPLRGHNNVQGASDFGSMPNVYLRLPEGGRRGRFARSSRRTGA